MPTPDDIAAQQRRLAAQRQTLGDLLVQQTSLDTHTPPYVRQDIREAYAENSWSMHSTLPIMRR